MIKATTIQAFGLLKEPVPEGKKDRVSKIINWGTGNNEPNKIIDVLEGSITGQSCVGTYERYLYGMGLNVDWSVGPYKANRLHKELSAQLSKLRGVAIHVSYDTSFKIAALKKVPFENFRLSEPNEDREIMTVKYNPYWGTYDFNKKYTIEYDLYDPDPTKIKQQIERAIIEKRATSALDWKGQIYYDSLTSEFNEFYPKPKWWSNNKGKGGGRKWMEIEQLVGDFHDHNIDKGFLQNVLMKVVGDPDLPIPEEKELAAENKPFRTIGEDFEEHITKNFAGAEAKKMLIMWAQNKDEFPDLQPFPTNSNHELFLALQKLCTENICIATQVPPVLAGVKVSGTLSKDDIENAVKLMWSMVDSDQEFLEEIYNKLFPLMKDWKKQDVNIMNYSPVSITLDEKIWGVMTREEKRQWVNDNTDIELGEDSEPIIKLKENGVQEPADNKK